MDSTTPADPLLLLFEDSKSVDVTECFGMELNLKVVVLDLWKPSEVEVLQYKK